MKAPHIQLHSQEEVEKLDHIPGLRVDNNYVAWGPKDALAIALKRLGRGAMYGAPKKNELSHPHPKLFEYQRAGVGTLLAMLQRDGAAILGDDMGLGKTAQCLALIKELNPNGICIVCPGSVRYTWKKEVEKWLGETPFIVETGAQAASADILMKRFVVTSYELSLKLHEAYAPEFLAMDEAHLIKGRGSKRGRRAEEMAACSTYRLAMTGTPMTDRPRDFWRLLRALFRTRFGSADEFDYAYCAAYENEWGGKENRGISRADELKARLNFVMVRRTKKDVATELPKLTRTVNWLEPEPKAVAAFNRAMLRRQSGDTSEALKACLEGKLDRAVELAVEAKRFLVFTWMKDHAYKLQKEIEEQGAPCVLITGDISVAARQGLVAEAATRKCGVVATIDSAGTGVDGLQHVASTVIFHAFSYTPTKLAQAEARLDRTGQTEPVTAIYLAMRECMDQLVIEKVVHKLDQWKALMGGDSGLRDTLNAHEDGAGAEEYERKVLAELYEAM